MKPNFKKTISLITLISAVIVGIAAFTGSIETIYKQIKTLLHSPTISIKYAPYIHEKSFYLEGDKKNYYAEMRNFASNCRLWRANLPGLPKGRAITPDPGAWLILKFHLENLSDTELTNLRLGIYGMGVNFHSIHSTPNVQSSLSLKTTAIEGVSTHVINIVSFPPNDKAIISIKSPITKKEYMELV